MASSVSFDEYFSSCPTRKSSAFFLAPAALDFYTPVYGTYGSTERTGPCPLKSRATRGYGGVVLEIGRPAPSNVR